MKKVLKNKKAFTLTEMIVVIAIIGILAGVLIPTITGYIKRANQSAAYQEAEAVLNIYETWAMEDESNLTDLDFDEYYAEVTEKELGTGIAFVEKDGEGKVIAFYYNGTKANVKIDLANNNAVSYSDDACTEAGDITDLIPAPTPAP